MRIYSLELQNIGTFIEGRMDFITENDDEKHPPVTIITGENGTGKTIILDAIRGMLGINHFQLERNIVRELDKFKIVIKNQYGYSNSQKILDNVLESSFATIFSVLSSFVTNKINIESVKEFGFNSIIDYFNSKLSSDSFEIQTLTKPNKNHINNLAGTHQNAEITNLICYFDYMRSSEDPKEKVAGEFLYNKLKEIVKISLNNGELAYVARTKLQPIINQGGMEITLDKLSSGNLYLIQRLVSLLGKMYALHTLLETPMETVCETEGLLLIDEAETHLHPKWQKTFISNILSIFPNLQIILTTHSPFIVSSVKNARVYVCKSQGDHCTIEDETEMYANMPVEEILLSPAFGETSPFSKEVEDLMKERKKAIKEGNQAKRKEIEVKLKAINPEYFAYFEVDKLLKEITAK